MTARIVGFVQSKGGTGKTTDAYSLAGVVAEDFNKRVLVVDGDPQGSVSVALLPPGFSRAEDGLSRLIIKGSAIGCISKTANKNIDCVYNDDPSGDAGGIIPSFVRQSATNMTALSEALRSVEDDYDYIFIDSVGAKSVLQEIVVYASDILICPMSPTFLDLHSTLNNNLTRLNSLLPLASIGLMPSGRPFPPIHILMSRFNANKEEAKNIVAHLKEAVFQEELHTRYPRMNINVLHSVIRERIVFVRCIASATFPHQDDKRDDGKNPSARSMLCDVAIELFPELNKEV